MTSKFRQGAALIGWQTLLADLSLILFMVTAAAMAAGSNRVVSVPPKEPARSEPLAVWRGDGSQTLRHWLTGEQPDPRQQLTITAYYRQGAASQALASAQALVREAGPMGQGARVIIEPAADVDGAETLASLAYDRAPASSRTGMARALLNRSGHPSMGNEP